MFKLGSDPEVFLVNEKGEFVSAIDVIPASKDNPLPTPHGFIQQDNILAEFNSKPASSLEEFVTFHKEVISDLREYISPSLLDIKVVASHSCGDELLSDMRALIGGCDPDYNAWTLSMNPPRDLSRTNLRVAGGHLHIGYYDPYYKGDFRVDFVRCLDLVLGIQSVLSDTSIESKLRKKLYGKAGSYRPKSISNGDAYDGVEYRTLSNYWLSSDKLMEEVYTLTKYVVENYRDLISMANFYKEELISIINNNSYRKAVSFVNSLSVDIPYSLI